MEFKLNKKEFYQAIQSIVGVVPTKTTIPILSHLLLDVTDSELTLTGTDLEVSISTRIPVQAERGGAVAVPGKILFEIVRELPEIPIEFSCDEEFKVVLHTEKGFYRLSGQPKEEFPKIAVEESKCAFSLDTDRLVNMINKTIFAVSTDELRTTLTGVYLKASENEVRMVSTDGHRLSKIIDKSFNSPGVEGQSIIPTKALNLVLKNCQNTDTVNIKLTDDHIVFEMDNTVIYSKGIEGQFPNYERVIPVDNDKRMVVNRDLLSASVRRVAIFSNTITNQIRMSLSANKVDIQSEDIEFGGEARETVESEYRGPDLEIGYNANYLLDILRHVDTDEVIFELKDPTSAALIYPSVQNEDEDLLMLLMPIRLNED